MQTQGTLYLCSIRDLNMYEVLDHKYYITRHLKSSINIGNYGFIHVKDLSPSDKLFSQYLNAKNNKEWGMDAYESWFVPSFKQEIKTVKALRDVLNHLYKLLKSGQDVAIACCCPDVNLCHRKVIGEEFAKLGFSVNVR